MSAFHEILEELVRADGAVGAVFADDSGETVDLATVEEPEEMRLLAAYAGIYLRQAQRFCSSEAVGKVTLMSVRCQGLQLHALTLKEGYSLIVARRSSTLDAVSLRRLRAAAGRIEQEAFSYAG